MRKTQLCALSQFTPLLETLPNGAVESPSGAEFWQQSGWHEPTLQ